MRIRLNAAQVAELAELLEDAPVRVGVIDDVLQAAAEGRGMTLRLAPASRPPAATPGIEPAGRSRHGRTRA